MSITLDPERLLHAYLVPGTPNLVLWRRGGCVDVKMCAAYGSACCLLVFLLILVVVSQVSCLQGNIAEYVLMSGIWCIQMTPGAKILLQRPEGKKSVRAHYSNSRDLYHPRALHRVCVWCLRFPNTYFCGSSTIQLPVSKERPRLFA